MDEEKEKEMWKRKKTPKMSVQIELRSGRLRSRAVNVTHHL